MATAEAQVEHATIDIAHTQVRAPFAGLVEETQVEIGDFVQPGSACATIIDLDPMLLVGRVAERDVHKLKLGTTASGHVDRRNSGIGNADVHRTTKRHRHSHLPDRDPGSESVLQLA